jgi:hypothetical protein
MMPSKPVPPALKRTAKNSTLTQLALTRLEKLQELTNHSVSTIIDALVRYPQLHRAASIVEMTVKNDEDIVEEWQDLGPPSPRRR